MLINIFEYINRFGAMVFNLIMQLGSNVFSIYENIISYSNITEAFQGILSISKVGFDNMFSLMWNDLMPGQLFNFNIIQYIYTFVNMIFGFIFYLFNMLTGLIGIRIPVNNILIIMVYVGCILGVFLLLWRSIAKVLRLVKDVLNPLN